MHVLSENLIATFDSLIGLYEEVSDELCKRIDKEECCRITECSNCLLLGNYYYEPKDYPLQIIKIHQSLKGSSNEP